MRLTLNIIIFPNLNQKMVKTRKQAKLSQENTVPKQPAIIPAKKQRKVKKSLTVSKQTLRETLKDRILKQRVESGSIKPKYIDFNNKEFKSIISPQKFNCPICLQIMIFPVLTQCGHAFCLPCIEESLKHKNVCSLCRESISYQHFKQSKLIQELIYKVCEGLENQEEEEVYRTRIKEFKDKDKDRKVDPEIEVGDFVDFYMNRSWTEGTIVQIDTSGQQTILKIQPTERQTKTYEFKLSSRLVARHRYFTKQNTLFREFMGQFRLQISGLSDIPIFQNLINVQINPVRSQMFEDGSEELIRFTFSIQP